jgi:hypothetical protein
LPAGRGRLIPPGPQGVRLENVVPWCRCPPAIRWKLARREPAQQTLCPRQLRRTARGTFERVGGHETIRVDVRIITATNRPLDEMIVETQKSHRGIMSLRIKKHDIDGRRFCHGDPEGP